MSNEELAILIKEGHKEYIEQLWLNIERFIVQQVNKFVNRSEGNADYKDDLYQASFFAMLEAIEAYDHATGYKFLTYMKYPLKNTFSETLGYRTKRDKHDPIREYKSLDSPVGEEDDYTLADTIEDPEGEEAFDNFIELETQRFINKYFKNAINTIENAEERSLIIATLDKNCTAAQAGRILGIEATRVHSIYDRALRKLKRYMASHRRDSETRELNDLVIMGYRNRSVVLFRNTLTSSTEYAALKLIDHEEEKRKLIQRMQDIEEASKELKPIRQLEKPVVTATSNVVTTAYIDGGV